MMIYLLATFAQEVCCQKLAVMLGRKILVMRGLMVIVLQILRMVRSYEIQTVLRIVIVAQFESWLYIEPNNSVPR